MEEKETLKSTRDQIEEFKNSMLWLDFKSELKRLYVNAGIEYDLVGEPHTDDSGAKIVPNSSETLIHLGEIKGRRKAVKYFLSIPDIFLQILEENKNDS
uniref:Uncharacterized protein n=1 Tax=viral metagenome TaxID=1070528 RepID=A0A6H1ZMG0_9ZZZZ